MATVWAATAAQVTSSAPCGVTSMPAKWAHCHTSTASSSHARRVPAATAGPGSEIGSPLVRRSRSNQRRPSVPTAATAAKIAQPHGPTTLVNTAGPATAPSTTTARMSAARSATVDAVAASTPTPARRTTESTRNGSPSRSGSTWFAPSERFTAASDWPNGRAGSTRVHTTARTTKAHPNEASATPTARGWSSIARQVRDSASLSTAPASSAAASASDASPTTALVHGGMRRASQRGSPRGAGGSPRGAREAGVAERWWAGMRRR